MMFSSSNALGSPASNFSSTPKERGRRPSIAQQHRQTAFENIYDPQVGDNSMTLRQKIRQAFEVPTSSNVAIALAIVQFTTILVSSVAFTLETLPEFYENDSDHWFIIETVCVMLFTLEYLVRFTVSESKLRFVREPLNVVDLASTLPWFVERAAEASGLSGTRILRVLRLTRIIRMFKLSRYSRVMQLVFQAFANSREVLSILLFFVTIVMVLFSSLVYFAERGTLNEHGVYLRDDGTESPFDSILASMWWTIITMTTVGYGRMTPITAMGKIIGAITMVVGILVISIPISVIGATFGDLYREMADKEDMLNMERTKQHMHQFLRQDSFRAAADDDLEDVDKILRTAIVTLKQLGQSVDDMGDRCDDLADEMLRLHRRHDTCRNISEGVLASLHLYEIRNGTVERTGDVLRALHVLRRQSHVHPDHRRKSLSPLVFDESNSSSDSN